jgi:hypothetical protein
MSINIPQDVYDDLMDDALLLRALRESGVDNWEWYDDACIRYEQLKEAKD